MVLRGIFSPIYYAVRAILCWIYCFLFDAKPKYEPNRWNDPYQPGFSYGHQWENNCYNYACNKATDSFAQPGYASTGVWNKVMACAPVSAGATGDGLATRPNGARQRRSAATRSPWWSHQMRTTTGSDSTAPECGRTSREERP
jgi:hypothetical protein